MPKLGQREQGIAAFQVMELVAEAQRLQTLGHDVVHLEVGEPDFPTPKAVVAAGKAALDAGQTFYTPAAGLPALQTALAAFYQRRYGVTVAPERFILTPGASGALQVVLSLMLDAGEQILLPEPGYPCNRQISALLNIDALCAPLPAERGFALDKAWLQANWQADTRALMVASPANPTGKVLSQAELRALQQWCAQKDAHLVVDEIYHGLNHTDDRSHSILETDPQAWVVNSFSKYFGMTGWRLGWAVVPDDAVNAANRVCQNLFLAPPTMAQHAAIRALQPDMDAEYESRRRAFSERRHCLLTGLERLGFGLPVAGDGAFYLYADISHTGLDAQRFCYDLLAQEQVAVTPGYDFGGADPGRYVRFAYTCDVPRLTEALHRIERFLQRQAGQ